MTLSTLDTDRQDAAPRCICGGTKYRSARGPFLAIDGSRTFTVVKCDACGLGRTDPTPFEDDVTADVHQGLPYEDVIAREQLWRSFFDPILQIARRHRPGGKFLDVGCGVGLCLQMAEEAGYEPWGVEINVRSATYAREVLGRRVLNSDLAAAAFPADSFSVVLLSHVLEHLAAPEAVFKEIRRILAPDGVVIVDVPNMDGLQARLLKERWSGWAPEMHVWQFTPPTLARSLEFLGFEPLLTTAKFSVHVGQPNSFVKRVIRATAFRFVELLASATNRGDKVLCVARKSPMDRVPASSA